MVKYVWIYVFQEVLDENKSLKVIKPPRFSHDYKITEDLTFKDALCWCLNISNETLESMFDSFTVNLNLWNKHPGERSTYRPSSDSDTLLVSNLGASISEISYKPYVHLVFSVHLRKKDIRQTPTIKKNAFDLILGKSRKLPDMVSCQNFLLSDRRKIQPLQETFNNFNDYLIEISLDQRHNGSDHEYSTKAKEKIQDKKRRKSFGHTYQTELVTLCV